MHPARLLTLLALASSPNLAQAVGYRLPNQDPEGIARGNAFVATADNPSAIFYNPAGITQLEGQNVSVGVYLISTDVSFRSAGGSASTETTPQAVPQIYYTWSPDESPLSFGLGIYAPYGLGIDYGRFTPFPTAAQDADLKYVSVNPVMAWEIAPCLSVAAGLTLNPSEVSLERRIGLIPGDEFQFDGNGYATGYNLGLLWQPLEEWSFGLNYRSATEINYKGRSITAPVPPFGGGTPTQASLKFPAYIVGGVSYRPNDDWNFEFNLDWTDWDSVDDAVFLGTFGGSQVFPFRYKSSFMYEFGITRQLGNGYFASIGYIFSENSVPDQTFSPLNPDSDLHLGSIGFGHRGECFGWAAGYHFAYNGGRTVNGNYNPTVDGEYETFNHALNLSVRYSF
ncbi:OmpP1/FadL family transporter [Luteolibacter marinus]|uniref:OmpP1/FadL family transporter n=1 Tax=Luteolibacter marinus TaxID=2776705 RepID=UPI001867F746|nr:outer membrane protein transport protein [Luteolibacter marinus]